ncbi:MAG: YwaF family protein [Clostridia bacterium]|nr:YwaF family protein [Clostridia bacterium]
MFTTNHFIWLAVCAVILAALIVLMAKFKPSQKLVLTVACICAALSESVKTLSMVEILPTISGGYTVYIDTQNLPFHLCSIQIFIIFAVRFMKEGKLRDTLLAFMYPTCALLPVLALMIPNVFSYIDVSDAFTAAMPYQYFLYHTMLIALGVYIAMTGAAKFRVRHIFYSVAIMCIIAYAAIYLNSAFASVDYSQGYAVVENITNFFYVYGLPKTLNLFTITEKWQWLAYFFCLVALVVVVFTIMYLPFILKNRKREALAADAEGEDFESDIFDGGEL